MGPGKREEEGGQWGERSEKTERGKGHDLLREKRGKA